MTAGTREDGELNLSCPCGSGSHDAECCARWHTGVLRLQAPDALTLMRSRYSAFARGRLDYLMDTWHPSTRPAVLAPLDPNIRWLGLKILDHRLDDPAHAQVEFVARSRLRLRHHILHERSRFVREDGRWFYLDGARL
jgi:SEC-C motif domain protein